MDYKDLPDLDYLHKVLAYDPESGVLTWRHRPREMFDQQCQFLTWNKRFAGKPAGNISTRDVNIILLGRGYRSHRIAWALHYGVNPDGFIDHINGDPKDNRISNLRVVTRQGNQRNMKRRSNNTSGILGVSWDAPTRKWRVTIRAGGRSKYVGIYATLDEAAKARADANAKHGYHPNHGRNPVT